MKATENTVAFFPGGVSRGRLESENPPKPTVGAPKGSQNHLKHGVHALTALTKKLGTDRALDKRTTTGKALARWRQDLIDDLGGDVSTQQESIITLAVKTKLILESIDNWLLRQPSLIDKRKRSLLPAVRERQALADALARYMSMLGLERRYKVKTISDLLNGHGEEAAMSHE
jgi:hypothetical protein